MIPIMLAMAFFHQGADCRSCDLLAKAAGALSDGNGSRFLDYVDKRAPHYDDLAAEVLALTAQDDVAASLDVLSESGDDDQVTALVDWFVQITSRDGSEHVTRRRMRVKVSQIKTAKGWRIAEISPISILGPVDVPAAGK